MTLDVQIKQDGQTATVTMSGAVDERADLSVIPLTGVTRLRLDLAGVTKLNSIGIRNWSAFFRSVPATVEVVVERCAVVVVQHINMMPNFFGNRRVAMRSFNAPYVCEECDLHVSVELDTAQHFSDDRDVSSPRILCERCQKPMAFDGAAVKYFLFLGRWSFDRRP